jgi:hypothetical protein
MVPCDQNKRPLIADWVNRASSDPAQLEAWEAEFCGCLWGILCGIAFDVLDVDPAGLEWALEHESDLRTYTQVTRRGGRHYYFEPNPELKNSQGKIAPGVDVKATGGIVIDWKQQGFPTVERAIIKMPEWIAELALGSRPKPTNEALSQLPPHGSLMCDTKRLPKDLYFRVNQLVPLSLRITRHHQRSLCGLLTVVVHATEGSRNSILNWSAFKMRSYIEAGIVTRANAERLLMEAARGYAASDGKEAAWATIQSGLGSGPDVGHEPSMGCVRIRDHERNA